jgi:hypothetical protein
MIIGACYHRIKTVRFAPAESKLGSVFYRNMIEFLNRGCLTYFSKNKTSFRVFGLQMLREQVANHLVMSTASVTINEKMHDVSTNITSSVENSTLKIILMWNAWSSKMDDKLLLKGKCKVRSCLFTTDMSLLQQSDIVVLHFDTLEDYPINRQPHQRFVFFHFESPENTASTLMNDPRIRYNYFNWTMTYRRDSDIFLRDFYGSLIAKKSIKNNTRESRYKYNNAKNRKLPIIERKEKIINSLPQKEKINFQLELATFIRKKSKMVTWFVGHCQTPILREEYVRQLSLYVSVDIFGNCTKKCPYNCDEMLRAEYKFYLAFENSWCPDYVTEKFIRPYVYDAVPIVLGGADYSQFAPINSYINAMDFESPKELADYLILLDKSNTLYAQYFNWKMDYYVSALDMFGWCDLCRMANDEKKPKKIYRDIKNWWMMENGECKTNSSKYF